MSKFVEAAERYILNQEQHHRNTDLEAELRRFNWFDDEMEMGVRRGDDFYGGVQSIV